jgi:hypothetical protein
MKYQGQQICGSAIKKNQIKHISLIAVANYSNPAAQDKYLRKQINLFFYK